MSEEPIVGIWLIVRTLVGRTRELGVDEHAWDRRVERVGHEGDQRTSGAVPHEHDVRFVSSRACDRINVSPPERWWRVSGRELRDAHAMPTRRELL